MKVSCCVIAKKENRYIKEFVEYYKGIGVDKIYLCDNNDLNGERFDAVLAAEIESGFVTVLDYRGKRKWQANAYNEVYAKFGSECDWMAFFDVDEFLTFPASGAVKTIKEFLQLQQFEACDAVIVNWMCYGDNDKLYYEDKPVIERFPDPLPLGLLGLTDGPHNSYVKSILRTGRRFRFRNPHCPSVRDDPGLKIVTAWGTGHSGDDCFEDPDYSVAYLRHYTTKTIEEFLYTMTRGDAHFGTEGVECLLSSLEQKFFVLNRKTQAKMDIIKASSLKLSGRMRNQLFRWIVQMKVKKVLSLRIFRHKLKLLLLYR